MELSGQRLSKTNCFAPAGFQKLQALLDVPHKFVIFREQNVRVQQSATEWNKHGVSPTRFSLGINSVCGGPHRGRGVN